MIWADDWTGLYGEGWQGEITPEAFSHPAKFSRGLIRRIYQHLIKEGWLQEGDCVVDPFGGVALGGLDAMANGLNWVGVELEAKFVELGNANIALWNARYASHFPRWGSAVLLQGDSRNLVDVLEANTYNYSDDSTWDGVVSSPPYADSHRIGAGGNHDETYINTWGGGDIPARSYSDNPSNLGNLPAGSLDAALSSPPYAESIQTSKRGSGIDYSKVINGGHNRTAGREAIATGYGQTKGQLGAMRAEGYEAAVSSPPFEQQNSGGGIAKSMRYENDYPVWGGPARTKKAGRSALGLGYQHQSDEQDNLANSTGDTFWTAARQIVEQTYAVLRPGAHAAWVVKSYVKAKQIVPFPEQWQALCEAVGFETVHIHRAWLVEDRGTQFDLEGNGHHKKAERKSFFRRLAEKKGSPRIDFEVILCMVKPGDEGGAAGGCVSSPPFTDVKNVSHSGMVQKWCEQNGRATQTGSRIATVDGYGSTPDNLGNLPAGDLDAALKPLEARE